MSFIATKKNVYIIAEISANHGGSVESACKVVRKAKECGADAVKIQTYTADTLTMDCDNEFFRIKGGTLWDGRTLYELYQQAYTPWEWHEAIFQEAERLGMEYFSTPFDETAVDFLEQFEPVCHKVASFELVHDPLLKKIAATHRPVIMSTGMASLEEITHAVEVLRAGGCPEICLLKCTSSYPAPAADANLRRIAHMADHFSCFSGLSDHTLDLAVPITAVALGARVIEKHFCLSRADKGPDSDFSLEPAEFAEMVRAIRIAELAIGTVDYEIAPSERAGLAFRRSLFFSQSLPSGHCITAGDIRVIRPGNGIAPRYLEDVIGRKTVRAIERGTPVSRELVE